MPRILLTNLALSLALTAASAWASSSQGDEMARARCGSIIDLFVSADPEVNTDQQSLAAAQDRTYVFLMWTHGYLSGRDGIDFARRPLNQHGINTLVGEIYAVCKDNEARLFLDAVTGVQR